MIRKMLFDLLPNDPRINFQRNKANNWYSFPLALSAAILLAVLFTACQEQEFKPDSEIVEASNTTSGSINELFGNWY